MDKNTAIAIVYDDHMLFADSFSALIERLHLFKAVYVLDDEQKLGRFLLEQSKISTPIYLFLDYYLKNGTGLSILTEARRLNRKLIVIMMSSLLSPSVIKNVLKYNPQGFVSKSSGFDIIIECLQAIQQERMYLCPVISDVLEQEKTMENIHFSSRELEILNCFAEGLTILETAEKMHLSKHTIVAHRRNMMGKAKVKSITELLAFARSREYIT